MKVEIKYVRFEYRHSNDTPRVVAFAQLYDAETGAVIIGDTTLSHILMHTKTNSMEVVNAQDLLYYLVIEQGFSS